MQRIRILTIVLSSLAFLGGCGGTASAQCPPIRDADRAKLIDYVQKKYKTPSSTKLEIGDISPVGATCFRRLVFQSAGGASSFRLELYASPDLRFLAKELLDSTLDPVAEERQKAEALASGLTNGNFPGLGKAGAPVTIAVFSDFECPYCARFAAIVKEVMPAETENVRLVFHNFPLPMHPWARPAAEAAACAKQQGDSYFWALHNFMFEHQKDLNRDNLLVKLAEVTKAMTGFDQGRFAGCVIERKTAAEVDQDVAFANQNGITGTPTAFVNGRKTQVVAPEQLRTLIRELCGAPKASTAPAAEAMRPEVCAKPEAREKPEACAKYDR